MSSNNSRVARVKPTASPVGAQRAPEPKKRTGRAVPAVKMGPWSPNEQSRYLQALAITDVVEVAARAIGRSKASALAERARDAEFAKAWDAVLESKVDRLEELLLDRTIARLDCGGDIASLSESAVRQDASVSMWLLEAHKPERYGKARSPAATDAPRGNSPLPDDPEARRQKVAEAIAAAERRMTEAEALMARNKIKR